MSSRGKGKHKRLYINVVAAPGNFLMLGEVRSPAEDFGHHQNAMKLIERNVVSPHGSSDLDTIVHKILQDFSLHRCVRSTKASAWHAFDQRTCHIHPKTPKPSVLTMAKMTGFPN
jgi:hypothetical protein